ncbi:MAG: type II secretion system protein GspD [Verrucomicrobia bacterium]|jgi:type II secretory pathway component GspD/PulD (secretin)|nr:type II secretion system protein GspD [Verrucomicrobiota bacterium]
MKISIGAQRPIPLYIRILLLFLLVFPTACRTPKAITEDPVLLSPGTESLGPHENALRDVLGLVRDGQWNEAREQMAALKVGAPDDPSVERVHSWLEGKYDEQRQLALEREIDAASPKSERFNPTLQGVVTDPKKKNLPISSTTREAFEQAKSELLVPESFNQTITRKGQLIDHERAPGRMERLLDKRVSLQLDNVSLETIIFTLGEQEGLNFIADRGLSAFRQTLSVNVEDVPLREFLDYVTRNMNVRFQVGDEIIWIVDGESEVARAEETRFYRLRKGFVMPAQFGATEVERVTEKKKDQVTQRQTEKVDQFVNDATAQEPSIQMAIERFFTGSDYMIDYERNVIVARGTREELRMLESIIEEFDRPIQQVLIEARFITVTEAAFLQLGATWETGRAPVDSRTPTDFTGFGTEVGLGLQETFTEVFSRDNLSVTLNALEQSGESETLSAPRLTVLNNRPARITDGKTQYYYEEYTVSQTILERQSSSTLVPEGKPTKIVSGVSLEVLASIGGDGRSIMLALAPKVTSEVELVTFAEVRDRNEDGQLVSSFDIRLPESRDQELATRAVVDSGETVVMGGVMERDRRTFVESVPLLGNIPYLGAAFRNRTEIDQPRYLLVFVTATLLSETGEFIQTQN